MAEHDVPPAIEEVEVGLAAHIGGVARLQRRRMEGEVQYRQAQVDGDVDRPARALCQNDLGRQRDPLGQARSEEHTSELQSIMRISYAVFCLKKKNLVITCYDVKYYQ